LNPFFSRLRRGLKQRVTHQQANRQWQTLTVKVQQTALLKEQRPVIFFNASTRLQAMSQNAAYSLLTELALRNQGIPVIQFICQAALDHCVLGSDRDDFSKDPPCSRCMQQSEAVFKSLSAVALTYKVDDSVLKAMDGLSIPQLEKFTHQGVPLGFWAVNSLRWVLRRHHLADDAFTRRYMRVFILSGWRVYQQFSALLDRAHPSAVVLFNGMFYPEAAARHACLERKIRVITHEVGLRPYSAFFTTGEATAYPVSIRPEFQLTDEMNHQLDEYLGKRFQGNFSMAGIRFWPEMKGLDEALMKKAEGFSKIVPVFTNVIFDTSQVHANTLFEHMFAWLDHVHATAKQHPEILFVLRAHPDEARPGKQSRESVAGWVESSGITRLPNVVFVDSGEFLSSYELIQRSHLVMVYNSTIGLEASIMGKPVLAGGKARFTQLPTAFFPATAADYKDLLERFLKEDKIEVPAEFQVNARRFLYYQLYATSLDFSPWLEDDGVWKGYVRLKDFPLEQLSPENSATLQVLLDGILKDGNFCYPV
jgi:hypothetical protein